MLFGEKYNHSIHFLHFYKAFTFSLSGASPCEDWIGGQALFLLLNNDLVLVPVRFLWQYFLSRMYIIPCFDPGTHLFHHRQQLSTTQVDLRVRVEQDCSEGLFPYPYSVPH